MGTFKFVIRNHKPSKILFMKFKNFYSQTQKEAINICKNNLKQAPYIKLNNFFELFNKSGLTRIETLTEIILSQNPKLKIYTNKLIHFFANSPSDFANKFYHLLTPKDDINNVKGSVIFIYGTNKSLARAVFGVNVYKKHPLPVIVSDKKESKNYKKILIENGFPKRDIFEEKQGRNFIENAYYSIRLAQKNKIPLNKIILVTASLVALRGVLTTQIFLSKKIKVYSCPVEYDPINSNDPTSPENWYKNNLGIQIFLSEIVKLYIMREEGLLKNDHSQDVPEHFLGY